MSTDSIRSLVFIPPTEEQLLAAPKPHADATMWYAHAIERYLAATGDRDTLELLIPKLIDIIKPPNRSSLEDASRKPGV